MGLFRMCSCLMVCYNILASKEERHENDEDVEGGLRLYYLLPCRILPRHLRQPVTFLRAPWEGSGGAKGRSDGRQLLPGPDAPMVR